MLKFKAEFYFRRLLKKREYELPLESSYTGNWSKFQSYSRERSRFFPLMDQQTYPVGITQKPNLPVRSILIMVVSIRHSLHKRANSITPPLNNSGKFLIGENDKNKDMLSVLVTFNTSDAMIALIFISDATENFTP